jgi:hypothetical protein
MKQDFIAAHIRRTNRNLLIYTVIVMGLSIFLISLGGIEALIQMVTIIMENPSIEGFFVGTFYFLVPGSALIIGLLLLKIAIVEAFKLIIRFFNIEHHPIHKNVSSYGYFNAVTQHIHYEVLNQGTKRYKNAIITDKWILQSTALNLSVLKIEDIVWAYNSEEHQKQGFVGAGISVAPTEVSKTYNVIIHSRNPIVPYMEISIFHQLDLTEDVEGNALEGMKKRDFVMSALEELEQRHPKAIFGYSRDLHEMWISDQASFIKSAGFAVD